MFDIAPLLNIFSADTALIIVIVPMVVVQLLALIFIPSMLQSGAKAKAVAKAVYCYLMQSVGIILMTIGVLPTLYSVFGRFAFTGTTYIGLLILFGSGGMILLWHDQMARTIDSVSRSVPAVIYYLSLRIIGNLLALFSTISLVLLVIMGGASVPGWWVQPMTMLLYGGALAWFSNAEGQDAGVFRSVPMNTTVPVKPLAPATAKVKRKAVKIAPRKKTTRRKTTRRKTTKKSAVRKTSAKKRKATKTRKKRK
jgi:hypothetical protein